MDPLDFFCSQHLSDQGGKGAGWRGGRHFQRESVSVCESKVEVCSSATFYGKVSFPPLCPRRLPDIDRACRLCVYVCRTDAAGFKEQHRKRQSSDRVGASEVKTGSSSRAASVWLLFWTFFFHVAILWLWIVGLLLLILSVAVSPVWPSRRC